MLKVKYLKRLCQLAPVILENFLSVHAWAGLGITNESCDVYEIFKEADVM